MTTKQIEEIMKLYDMAFGKDNSKVDSEKVRKFIVNLLKGQLKNEIKK